MSATEPCPMQCRCDDCREAFQAAWNDVIKLTDERARALYEGGRRGAAGRLWRLEGQIFLFPWVPCHDAE